MNARAGRLLAGADAAVSEVSPANTLGVLMLVAYLFFLQSRLLDFTVPQLHLPMVLLIGMVGLSLLSSNLFAGLRVSAGRLLLLFVFLLGLSALFSIDRRQSVGIVTSDIRHLTMCFAMMSLLVSVRDIRRCLQGLAWGTLVAAVLGFVFQVTVEGQRLGLETGRFGDPNDYAMVLVMGLPLWLTVASGVPRVVLGIPAAAVIFFSFARAGSRGGLLAFGALTVAYAITSSFMGKLRVGLLLVVTAVAAVSIVPAGIQKRYFTIFSVDEDSSSSTMEAQRSYIESSNSRKALLIASIWASFRHPVFGVGPGGFPQYYWQQGFIEEKRNRQGMHTHNTYTQVSSEAGIPAAICLLTILFLTFRMAWRAWREPLLPETHPIRVCGRAIWLSMVGWASAALFLSMAWTEVIFIYVALAGSLWAVQRKTIANMRKQAAQGEKPVSNPAKPGRMGAPSTGLAHLRPIS
jgi:O-antigen ligase